MNEYSVELLTADDGFVSSEIYSIIQDRQGFLWFGTAENGVMRYDGRKVDAGRRREYLGGYLGRRRKQV